MFVITPPPLHPHDDACLSKVHGRTVRQAKTQQGMANWDIIRQVKEAVSIPVVGNGGVRTRADAEQLLEVTGADAVMSSEGLLEDPSLFDRDSTPLDDLEGVEVCMLIYLFFSALYLSTLEILFRKLTKKKVLGNWNNLPEWEEILSIRRPFVAQNEERLWQVLLSIMQLLAVTAWPINIFLCVRKRERDLWSAAQCTYMTSFTDLRPNG